jgi:hypothetical protein
MSPRAKELMAVARERLEAAGALLVASGDIDVELAREARATQEPREGVDYAAARVSPG